MKLSLPGVLFVFIGVVLVYSAYNKRDPRNVVLEALGSKRRVSNPMFMLEGVGSAVGGAAGDAAGKAVPGKGVPNTGSRPPAVGGIGPIVTV